MFELTFDVFSLLMSIALIIAITFGLLLLFSKSKNNTADRFLASLLFIVALWNASLLILVLGIYQYAAGIIWVPLTFTLALGPCFYFYTWHLTNVELRQKPQIWPHFIPVFFEVLLFLYEVFQGLPLGVGYFDTPAYLIFDPIVNALAIFSLIVYSIFSRKRIQHYHRWVEDNFSHYHRYNLNWLLRLSTIFLIVLTLWLGYFCIDYFLFDYQLSIFEYYPFHLSLAIISIWLSVEAFSKSEILYPEKTKQNENNHKSRTELDIEIVEKANWLKQQIERDLLYLDPELSLKSLAETINLNSNVVSKIINDGLNQTFSDCINEYRVNAVKKKLSDSNSKNTTFLAIAFDCGFNSKTTFNRVFKKHVGVTPLQFKNNSQ